MNTISDVGHAASWYIFLVGTGFVGINLLILCCWYLVMKARRNRCSTVKHCVSQRAFIHRKLEAGRYNVEFTIPAASHQGDTWEKSLNLTAEQANRFLVATTASTIFLSGYADPKHESSARELEDLLRENYPEYSWPVGVIWSIGRVMK